MRVIEQHLEALREGARDRNKESSKAQWFIYLEDQDSNIGARPEEELKSSETRQPSGLPRAALPEKISDCPTS